MTWTTLRTLTDEELLRHVASRDALVQTEEEIELVGRFEWYVGKGRLLDILDEYDIVEGALEEELAKRKTPEEIALLEMLEEHEITSIDELRELIESSTATQE